jgi:pimeloyl-[acyl-carrier protein] methyl ester esterase
MTPPVSCVFIGGWGSTDAVWRTTLAQVALSEPHFIGWLDCLKDWPGVLTTVGARPGRCVLVGWSLGSLLALRAALELPEKIVAMVLVSATACLCDGVAGEAMDTGGIDPQGIDPRTLAAMRVRVKRNPGPVLDEFARQCAMPDGDEEMRACYLRQANRFSPGELALGLEALAALDLRERLGEIKAGCRVLHGDGDRIVPLRSAQLLASKIAGAGLEVLEGRGHALPFTAPSRIAQCIVSVLG